MGLYHDWQACGLISKQARQVQTWSLVEAEASKVSVSADVDTCTDSQDFAGHNLAEYHGITWAHHLGT